MSLHTCTYFLGQLSYWIYKAIEHSGAPSLLLVDKGSQRHKFDNKLDKVDGTIQRIRIDIADLILHEVDVVKRSKGCIGVSKHLCGDATGILLVRNYKLVLCTPNSSMLPISFHIIIFVIQINCRFSTKMFNEK